MNKTSVICLLISASLLGLYGCASDQGQTAQGSAQPKPVKDTRPNEERLKIGMTEDEVRAAIGNPKGKSTSSDGSQTWIYTDSEMAFIPNYTLFGGKIHHLVVMFDTTGKVKSWSTSESGRY